MDKKISGKKIINDAIKFYTCATTAAPFAKKALDKYEENVKDLIDISDIYPKNRCVLKDGIEEVLNKRGLNVQIKPLMKSEADSKYHDYRDSQIVRYQVGKKTNPKSAKIGSIVVIDYITQEVIDESILLFEEEQKIKEEQRKEKEQETEEKKREKEKVKGERRERRKEKVSEIKANAKGGEKLKIETWKLAISKAKSIIKKE